MKAATLLTMLCVPLVGAALQAQERPAAAASPNPLQPLPMEWSVMGNGGPLALPGRCELGVDMARESPARLYSVRCANASLPSFGGARYAIQTAQYRGKRVRVSASLMLAGVDAVETAQHGRVQGEAGLWLGVGSPSLGMRMDRMADRTLGGTTDWERRDFVVDVPQDNNQMMVGFWMQGKGQVWARDFRIEEVPATVPVSFQLNELGDTATADLGLAPTRELRADDRFLPPPAKWLALGAEGFELCETGIDAQLLRSGQRNLSISCGIPQVAALRQGIQAAPYWGRRVRFSGWIRTEGFEPLPSGGGEGGAGLMLQTNGSRPLHANLHADADWQHHELVLEVPRNSMFILIGLGISGEGQVWGRDFRFEEVPPDTPLSQPAGAP